MQREPLTPTAREISMAAAAAQLTARELANPRSLIPDQLFGFLADRIAREEHISQDQAQEVIEQALAFLVACGLNPDVRLFPSPAVEIAWEKFLTYTRAYGEFCQQVAGRFIHHWPIDVPKHAPPDSKAALQTSVEAMRAAGLPVVDELWTSLWTSKIEGGQWQRGRTELQESRS
ncbi:glycine-rich domain-containing protein [Streptosporangium sp. CA-115845]|uniref:glycine-rich domain-containing protein n=1 Tax=Streptosporangium sp. CA-115845 TaxID=3240071 RepID=UPI003D932D7B